MFATLPPLQGTIRSTLGTVTDDDAVHAKGFSAHDGALNSREEWKRQMSTVAEVSPSTGNGEPDVTKEFLTLEGRARICRSIPAAQWKLHKDHEFVAIHSDTGEILFSGDDQTELEDRIEATLAGTDETAFTTKTKLWRPKSGRGQRPR